MSKEKKLLDDIVGSFNKLTSGINDAAELFELSMAEEDWDTVEAVGQDVEEIEKEVAQLEFKRMFNQPMDSANCYLEIQAGAGGTEAQDWAEMLFRMYTKWAAKAGFEVEILDMLDGDEAGLKSVTIQVNGENAYGYLKSEKGIHRLVRVSPFDSSGRRHTSFASCDVMPEIENDNEIEVKADDIRIDTYRASGAGGQHVNKTSSAIRITHFPTGVVVQCQDERSQFANKERAFKMLKSKLLALKIEEQMQKLAEIRGDVKEIGWGSQIRSYVFMPYTMVKDHRTGEETGNVGAVMDGDIDNFISAYLAWIHS